MGENDGKRLNRIEKDVEAEKTENGFILLKIDQN